MTASAFTHGASQSQLCQCFLCLTKPRGIQCGFALEKQEKKKKPKTNIACFEYSLGLIIP